MSQASDSSPSSSHSQQPFCGNHWCQNHKKRTPILNLILDHSVSDNATRPPSRSASERHSQISVGARPADITDHDASVERPVITDPDALPIIQMQPVGVVLSPYRNHFDTPRQPTVQQAQDGIIQLRKGLQNMARDLKDFDRIWVLFEFNYSRGARHTVKPPRGDGTPRGLFATRSPHRPNPIGLSCVRCLNVVGRKIFIRDHDLLHGTPVLDIKPYLPYCDAHPDAQAGWVDDMTQPGPDHRWE